MISNSKTESANTIIVIEAPLKPTAALPPSSKSTDRKTKKWIPLFATVLALLAGIFLYLWIAGGKSQPTAASPINVSALNSSEINKLFTVDGKCGFQGGVTTTCSESLPCCSQYSWCGSSPDHCSNQQIAFSFQSQQAVVVAATSASTQQIPSWETCFTPSSDVCAEAGFSCCVSPHDVSTKKFTCRPTTDASECSIYPSSSSSVVVAPSASSDGTCGGASGFSCPASMPCCSQHNWCGSSADHCNSYSLAQFSFGGSVSVVAPAPSSPISYSSPSTQSSSSSASMWVTPYQMGNGYTASNWPNPGGCTGTTEILKRAFPSSNTLMWTGEQKNEAIQMIAARYSYRLIASPSAPSACFKIATIVSSAGIIVDAIVLDFSSVYHSENVGDVSQAVIDILGGVPNSGHIDVRSISFSDVQTFQPPAGFP